MKLTIIYYAWTVISLMVNEPTIIAFY